MLKGESTLKVQPLTEKIDKLHTTELGAIRIRRNLNLQTDDIISWCKEFVRTADLIIGQGKNWYAYKNGMVITINKRSNTIITAHFLKPKIRPIKPSDYVCLPEFLYQSIFIPEGVESPPRSIINDPQIFAYIKDFGNQAGDLGVVAEQNGQVIGTAWTRIIPAYGHINENTPELAISILPEFRGYGIGTKLMKKLFEILKDNGYKQTSLSVQKDNPATKFYLNLGYKVTKEKLDHVGNRDFIMVKELL